MYVCIMKTVDIKKLIKHGQIEEGQINSICL